MANFPESRLKPAPPFTYCAVDWLVKQGRKEVKRYGFLFTCLASRAGHIEVSLDVNLFLLVLRRFFARRGREISSDQRTNFFGADNELKRAYKEMDDKAELLKHNIDWKRNFRRRLGATILKDNDLARNQWS
ncbi:Hypothetical predicted protein [Paramuricea clavata]|uniref:Uncharacterized protein n=1 Tax=Paramuricea clavata TaxID=317549 RepID=A0A7D9L5W7_PARCT|nr:Hypothetical predicted protein [Paramuricea clavata]